MPWLWMLLACGGLLDGDPAEGADLTDGDAGARGPVARASEAAAPEAAPALPVTVTVRGELRCPGVAGPWVVEGYRVPSGRQRGTDEPAPPVQVATVALTEGEPAFAIEMPPGPRRRVLARAGDRVAYPARGEQPWDITTPIVGLVLDCGIGVEGLPEVRANQHKRPMVSEEAWVAERGGGSGGLHRMQGYDARQAEGALRARYKDRLSEDELNTMMPLLVQVGQEPQAADELVSKVVRARGAAAPAPKIGSRGRR